MKFWRPYGDLVSEVAVGRVVDLAVAEDLLRQVQIHLSLTIEFVRNAEIDLVHPDDHMASLHGDVVQHVSVLPIREGYVNRQILQSDKVRRV